MKIFRMERDGHGPFTTAVGMVINQSHGYYMSLASHPTPCEDGISTFPHAFVCGTSNLKQFFHWFPKFTMKEFEDQGFRIAVCEIEDKENLVIHGNTQVLFKRNNSKIEFYAPTEWSKIEET